MISGETNPLATPGCARPRHPQGSPATEACRKAAQQAAARSLLRDLYSPHQLQEQMTWFWLKHFNVQADKRDIRAMIGDYEDQAIRPRALGKFRDLLKAADLHPAMLRYLDNDQNAVGRLISTPPVKAALADGLRVRMLRS